MQPVTALVSSCPIPPELFALIASFIPLRSAPWALRSLALGNHRLYDIVHPLLYSRLILRSEDDAITVIQKILDQPQLGLAVTEIYLMSGLSLETRQGGKAFDAISGLRMLVERRLIPRLLALGIYLLNGWIYDEDWKPILHGRLHANFWRNLRSACPRLRTLVLRNVGHCAEDSWLRGPVIDEINCISGLSSLCLEWGGHDLSERANSKILKNLPSLASLLHTLSLTSDYKGTSAILSIDFPNLKRLCLIRFESEYEASQVMAFFWRHSQLESLSLIHCCDVWFSKDVRLGFLPNLKHLKARFEDIRLLVPILPQLVSLAFVTSCNGQVPYLLRAVLPTGLPRLKSLEIEHQTVDWSNRRLEGVLWYETLDGHFCTEKRPDKVPRNFMDGYMHSIVKGTPNLEELGLHGMTLNSEDLHALAPTLAQLMKLERFYYRGFSPNPRYGNAPPLEEHERKLADFLSSAEALSRVCLRLEAVTSISAKYLPYISAIIERNVVGDVIRARRSDGVGMLISADENDPFPCNT